MNETYEKCINQHSISKNKNKKMKDKTNNKTSSTQQYKIKKKIYNCEGSISLETTGINKNGGLCCNPET